MEKRSGVLAISFLFSLTKVLDWHVLAILAKWGERNFSRLGKACPLPDFTDKNPGSKCRRDFQWNLYPHTPLQTHCTKSIYGLFRIGREALVSRQH